jgi:3-hydroxyisobutyrate dehydrogenase-like beta-hydroxyacid dehydrogenase
MAEKVGFVGLGDIGLPMTKRVVGGGYEVTVCGHVRQEPVEEMKSLGAKEVKTAKEVALASEVTITMVRDDTQSEGIILGPNGVMEGSKEGSGIIMMSTLSPAFCKRVGQAGKEKGVGVLDSPVSGTRVRAATGELTLMVGGEKELVEKYRPILETMGRITYCGDLGAGQIVKLVNNMTLFVNINGLMEALNWGIKNGADEDMLIEVLKKSTGNSWVAENWKNYVRPIQTAVPRPIIMDLGLKDLELMLDIANEMKIPVPIAALVSQLGKFREKYLRFWD